jgi:uncharacterized protein (DUF983 family)
MLRATVCWRCPACGEGPLFAGGFTLRPTCAACAARFERGRGEWTGPVVISYTLGAGLAFLLWVILFATGTLFPWAEPLVALLAVAIALGSYRFAKAWWVWLLYEAGLVYPDTPPKP